MMVVVLCIPSGTMAGLLEFNQQKVYSKMVCLLEQIPSTTLTM